MAAKSNLDLVNECDTLPYFDNFREQEAELAKHYRFKIEGYASTLGYIPTEVAQKFPLTDDWARDDQVKVLEFRPRGTPSDASAALAHRNKIMADYLQDLREKKVFVVLAGWRNELYPVYGPNRQLILSMERSASALLGVVTYGVHMTAYVNTPQGIKFWLPKRSPHKQTFPGMMDNTVAGGLSTGEIPFECLVRESMEEASIPEQVIRKYAVCCGALTYHYLRDANAGGEVGLSQPECEYVYDLELPDNVIPKPNDQEAVDFRLLTLDEVKEALAQGKFKPNCAHVILDFFVRHGIITPENEPNYSEIVPRFHRRLDHPMM